MRDLLVLGGGTAGTMIANQLHKRLPREEWRITAAGGATPRTDPPARRAKEIAPGGVPALWRRRGDGGNNDA